MSEIATSSGMIIKATGGFYYVRTQEGDVPCRARGLFRFERERATPLVGDMVQIQLGEDGSGTVVELHPRKNALVRPPLANLDYMVMVTSSTDPAPNLLVLDKFLAILENNNITPVIAITKPDLKNSDTLAELYRSAGFPVYVVCNTTGQGALELRQALVGKLSAFSGNSGVGKSSLLNCIDPRIDAPVGDTSKKLGRGRHTTRHVELFALEEGGWIADTPGFSSIDLEAMGGIDKEDLAHCFREFRPYLGDCRFTDCSHTREKGCAVLAALDQGEIAQSRHQSYAALYDQVKDVKEWEKR